MTDSAKLAAAMLAKVEQHRDEAYDVARFWKDQLTASETHDEILHADRNLRAFSKASMTLSEVVDNLEAIVCEELGDDWRERSTP